MTSIIETFFRHHANPCWICEGEELRFADSNDAAIARYGLSREAFDGLTLRDLHPGVAPLLTGLRMLRDDRLPADDEVLQHHFRDGSILELTLRGISLDIGDRHYRLVISRDVTDRAAQGTTDRQLGYIERHASRIARIGGWRFDTGTQLFAYTAAAREILRLRPEDRGDWGDAIQTISPTERAAALALFETCIGSGEPIDHTFTIVGPAGVQRRLRTIAEAEFGISGKVAAIVGVVQDMTVEQSREEMLAAQQALWARTPLRDEAA
ncbi:PAS domain-containing protein [Novosphingobium sp. JCM 18896]|uniref:PAS domain-containing protein n=1 Tax=Novosphingobium sp. JCM 18896 TaxID=2989731 RepID=UPI002221A9B8|nr:PAS domain-containing protein [Novosphingobium sp. JCM 18896]MCW1431791.1 hypothetical protein [Novosphingobium sp. JCM 18896]